MNKVFGLWAFCGMLMIQVYAQGEAQDSVNTLPGISAPVDSAENNFTETSNTPNTTGTVDGTENITADSSGNISIDRAENKIVIDSIGDSYSGEPQIPIAEPQSCSELYDELKKSDCGRTIFKYIKGASIKVGITFNTSSIEIKSNDSLYARLVGTLNPAPYYGFALRPRYFGRTYIGYQMALDYTSSATVEQVIQRGEKNKTIDLHTLSILNLAAITPSVFFDVMRNNPMNQTFLRIGLGVGLGWSSVRGVAYFTEKVNEDFGSCYEVSTNRLEGTTDNQSIKSTCTLENFKYSSVGASIRVFIDGRWQWIYGAVEAVGVGLRTQEYEIVPSNVKAKIAYMLDI